MSRSLRDARVVAASLLMLACARSLAEQPTGAAPAPPPSFNPEHGVVVPQSWAPELLKQCSRPTVEAEGTWTPNETQIRELERRLAFELDRALRAWHPRLQEAMRMNLQVGNYYRQYIGIVVSGRRVIYVNGFGRSIVERGHAWKSEPVRVCDGGAGFWHAAYDPERRTFVVFTIGDAPGTTVVFNGVA